MKKIKKLFVSLRIATMEQQRILLENLAQPSIKCVQNLELVEFSKCSKIDKSQERQSKIIHSSNSKNEAKKIKLTAQSFKNKCSVYQSWSILHLFYFLVLQKCKLILLVLPKKLNMSSVTSVVLAIFSLFYASKLKEY